MYSSKALKASYSILVIKVPYIRAAEVAHLSVCPAFTKSWGLTPVLHVVAHACNPRRGGGGSAISCLLLNSEFETRQCY